MKLTNKKNMSYWAFEQCKNGNDNPEMRNLITDSSLAYSYCRDIKDIEEMWKKITEEEYATYYCEYVKDRPEVRKHIRTSRYIYKYCTLRNIEEPELASKITSPTYIRKYIDHKFMSKTVKSLTCSFTHDNKEFDITFNIPKKSKK